MSSRGLVRSMLVIGSTQAVSILISILRMKVLALLLGPAGIGLLSLYNSLQGMVAITAGLGMSSSGVRQIASVKGEEQALSQVRRVLFAAHLVQGGVAMLGVWLLRAPIARWLIGDETHATEVGLIGVAVLLALLSAAQTALLQGLRRIGDLGRVTVLGALAGTIVGLSAVWLCGQAGLIWFVVAQPLATWAVALQFTRKLPTPTAPRPGRFDIWAVWKPMARLGIVFMLGGLATTATLLLVRSRVTQELGLDAAGQFAAAWGITMTYVGFLLGAMAADYYPRLTEVINDRPAAASLMNDQAQLGLAIGGPVLLLLIGLAPWAMRFLYSAEFAPATSMLQWQTVGNVFKLASWPLGFAFAAAARSKVFLFVQLNWNILFLAMLWFGLPIFGLEVAGAAFLFAYAIHFMVVNILVRRLHGFRWEALSLHLLGTHMALAFALLALSLAVPLAGAVASIALALLTGLIGLRVVLHKVGPTGRLATRFARFYTLIRWPLEKKDD